MCEWLSCREWCDVQLQCGGRTFSAHRAVLASVSAFLRQILLSTPIEESPTFIVLPDFDLEAMSSVLYYIYNGEVVIQKQKLEMFMDIIQAMQIFIDCQYLPKLGNGLEKTDTGIDSSTDRGRRFSLDANNFKEDQQFVNVKKGKHIQEIVQQYLNNDKNFHDKQETSQDLSEHQQKTSLGNLQSSYRGRQRNCFLRDLFMETYPRNGNANGRTAGVLAIPSEPYRAPTSVLLTHANDKYPKEDLLSEGSDVENIPQSSNIFQSMRQLHRNQTFVDLSYVKNVSLTGTNSKSLYENYNRIGINFRKEWINYFPLQSTTPIMRNYMPSYLDLSIAQSRSHKSPLNSYCITSATQNACLTDFDTNNNKGHYGQAENSQVTTTSYVAKNTIFNQVLESPWCPRLPNNYRPFRRKNPFEINVQLENLEGKETEASNDGNNNVYTSAMSALDVIGIYKNGTKQESDNSYSVPHLVGITEHKCTLCDKVFPSSESLASHMRHHAATARYTCGECSKSFSQLRNFKYHMSIHRGTREFAATCPVCGKYFNDRGYLSSHMKIHRNRKEYKCSQCPKSFNQRVAYNMHVRIHTGVKPHVCSECGKAFSRKMLLKQHLRTHSGERPYACPHCDKRFADRSNMTLHLRLHSGVKPFSCTLCSKSFTKKHHLKSHLNFHTGAKPYSCPRCNLAFTQSSNMRTHMKKCTAPEPSDIASCKAPGGS